MKSQARGKAADWLETGSAILRNAVVKTSKVAVEPLGAWRISVTGWLPSEGFGKGGPTTVCRTGVDVPVELGVELGVMVAVKVGVEVSVDVGVEVAGATVTLAVEELDQLNWTAWPLVPEAELVVKL